MSMRVIVVGGGYAGLRAVQRLSRLPDFSVTLVEPRKEHVLRTRLVSSAVQRRPLKEVLVPFEEVLPKGIQWVREPAVSFDPELGTVETDRITLTGDRILLCTGSIAKRNVSGSEKYGFSPYSLEDCRQILHSWSELQKQLDRQKSDALALRWVVVGGGTTGVALAAELAHLARRWRGRYKGQAGAIQVHLVHEGMELLPGWRPSITDWVQRWLEKHQVVVHLATKVRRARPDYLVLERKGETSQLDTRSVFWSMGQEPHRLEEEPEGLRDEAGFCKVDNSLRLVDYPKVYALGGNILAQDSAIAKIFPNTGPLSVQQAEWTVQNLEREAREQEPLAYIPEVRRYSLSLGAFDGAAMIDEQDLIDTAGWTAAQAEDLLYRNSIQLVLPALTAPARSGSRDKEV
jgi:NADH:ubiquinone reductase (H+-translocating)